MWLPPDLAMVKPYEFVFMILSPQKYFCFLCPSCSQPKKQWHKCAHLTGASPNTEKKLSILEKSSEWAWVVIIAPHQGTRGFQAP